MKKAAIWILSVLGILAFLILLLFVISLYIRKAELGTGDSNTDSVDRTERSVVNPTPAQELEYNNSEGSKIKKSGYITFLVEDLDEAYDGLVSVNGQHSGEVTNIYDSGKGNDRYIQVVVKVPVEQFESYYEAVRGMGGEVTYANINTVDVTDEYIDITSRLSNLESVESQLVGILAQAETVEDILAVQSELTKVRGEIERYEAQKRYFDSQADYSYVTVLFNIDKTGLNITDDEWKPLGEFKVALNTLVSVFRSVVNLGIWVLVFSPVVLIPVGIVWLVARKGTKTA